MLLQISIYEAIHWELRSSLWEVWLGQFEFGNPRRSSGRTLRRFARAAIDPASNDRDFRRVESLPNRRHGRRGGRDTLQNQASGAVARQDDRTTSSALECFRVIAQRQAAGTFVASMACQAMLGKNRMDAACEVNVGCQRHRADRE